MLITVDILVHSELRVLAASTWVAIKAGIQPESVHKTGNIKMT
jgi:hypothetical protein